MLFVMLTDVMYKLARKSLGGGFYQAFSRSVLGRTKGYAVYSTYLGILDHYLKQGLEFKGKVVLEVGSGNQLFTALLFLARGADQVLIAEPMFSMERFVEDLESFNRESPVKLDAAWARARIHGFASLEAVPREWDGKVGVGCSHNVLEHFHDVPGFFRQTARLLSPGGISYSKVDVSDHTYHIFAKYRPTAWLLRKRMLYHLRYSRRGFERLNDPKCFMNRVLLPEYLELARRHGLKVKGVTTEPQPPARIHPDLLPGSGIAKPEEIHISGFGLKVSL